jgi:iron complex transport system substrate-binding protein
VWEIGARGEVVGVTKYSSYLGGADGKENVSGGGQGFVVAEKVVALEPDLVLAPNVIDNDTVQQLRDAGLTVYRFEGADSIDFVIEKTRLTGELVGECEGAEETATWMEDRIGTVRDAVEGEERPNVLYTFFGYTVNEGTFIHEMITTAGGENVAANADLEGAYPQLSNEVVANSTVDWLLLNSDSPTVPENEAYNSTRAVQEGNVLVLEANYISQPAPRIVYPIVKMAEAFHPEAYAEANSTATPTETETEAGPTSPTPDMATDTPEPTETDGQPGFGIVAAAIALVATLLAARAR